jgi:hypothetical protein
VEAKRLRDDEKASVATTLSHYFGADGVGRFVSGRYEAEGIEAAMLGCIQAHNAGFWFERFEAMFASDIDSGRNEFKLAKRFQRCSVIAELTDEASTTHHRADGSTIRLMHIALDCS